jgi:P27 family predicted phage terminase small subunit
MSEACVKGTKPNLVQAKDAIDHTKSAPGWMSKDAKAEWKRVFPSLVSRKILTQADLGGLENYCVAVGRVREIERELQKALDPVFVRMQDKAMQTARQLAAELGLTPVSRSRPSVRDNDNEDDEDNPLNVS